MTLPLEKPAGNAGFNAVFIIFSTGDNTQSFILSYLSLSECMLLRSGIFKHFDFPNIKRFWVKLQGTLKAADFPCSITFYRAPECVWDLQGWVNHRMNLHTREMQESLKALGSKNKFLLFFTNISFFRFHTKDIYHNLSVKGCQAQEGFAFN